MYSQSSFSLEVPLADLPWRSIKKFALKVWDDLYRRQDVFPNHRLLLLEALLSRAEEKLAAYDRDKLWGHVKDEETRKKIEGLLSGQMIYGPVDNNLPLKDYYTEIHKVCDNPNSLARRYKNFVIYSICNSIFPTHALLELNKDDYHFQNAIPTDYQLDLSRNYYDFFHGYSKEQTGRYILKNNDLLNQDESQMPVFILERSDTAEEMQRSLKQGFIDNIFKIISDSFGAHEQDPQIPPYITRSQDSPPACTIGPLTSLNPCLSIHLPECLSALRLLLPEPVKPVGNAICVAPCGRYGIPSLNNWADLNNRDVYIFKCKKPLEETYSELLNVAEAIIMDTCNEMHERISMVILDHGTSEISDVQIYKFDEFVRKAALAGVTIPVTLSKIFDEVLRDDLKPSNRYLVEPFLSRRSWAMITGEEGSGKSWLGLGIAAAIASKGKLFLGLKVKNRPRKVLYLADDEMDQATLEYRQNIFRKMYPSATKNFIVRSVSNYDLTLFENEVYPYREKITKTIEAFAQSDDCKPIEVLVIDHLLKFSDMQGSEAEKWKSIRAWITELCREKNISVLLLHHEYGGGKMRGSRDIAADAPARISLKKGKRDGDKNIVHLNVSLYKNRSGFETDYEEIDLPLDRPRWVMVNEQANCAAEKNFKSIKDHDGRLELLRQYRNAGLKNREIAEKLQCSVSTLNIYIKELDKSEKRLKGYQEDKNL